MSSTLSKQQLTELHEQLLATKNELSILLALTDKSADVVTLDQSRVGRLSRMDAMQQQQMAKAGKQRQEQQLQQVIRALKRIDEESYGYCNDCDDMIAFPRLKIRPESVLCVNCQSLCEND